MTIFQKQQQFYSSGQTLSYSFRKENLIRLKTMILTHQKQLEEALYADLGKSPTEAYMTEIGLVLSEISYQLKHLKRNMKQKRVKTPLSQFPSKSYRLACPYGSVLIICPWNYPLLLSLQPLAGAMASGNTVTLKLSEYSHHTSLLLKQLIKENFKEEYICVQNGDSSVATALLQESWNFIFFTGSEKVGRIVYEQAASKLIPVVLELGGKSPVILDATAPLDLAAKRIVFGKLLNAGQTCVAPDYLLVEKKVKDQLVERLIFWMRHQYPTPLDNPAYPKIISSHHFNRILNLFDQTTILYGGKSDSHQLKIEPTIIDEPSFDQAIMKEEIFAPILPILCFETDEQLLSILNRFHTPLACYLFTDKKRKNMLLNRFSFGGGCVNDTIIHLANLNLPFGGIGTSGIGSYHGGKSFEVFSHYKSILEKSRIIDLPMRYAPYSRFSDKLIKKFLK